MLVCLYEHDRCARCSRDDTARRFEHTDTNVAFHEDFIETADVIPDGSVDLVISDCVINLSPAKDEVFQTIWRVLKPGGEFYVADIAADRRVPDVIRKCEDYGQTAVYRGTMPNTPARFALDDHHVFEARRPAPVCRNTARMLSETRLLAHFEVTKPIRHFGLFACAPAEAPRGPGPSCC